MNWEAIGAAGEILGATAVVATLFYLSIQMKQNSSSLNRANDYAQARSIHETNSLYVEVISSLVRDSEMASIYHRALAGETLGGAESVRFSAFVNSYLVWAEDLYFQQETELGFAAVGDTALFLQTVGPYIIRLLRTESGGCWWRQQARHHLSPPFYGVVSALLSDGEKS